MKVPGSPRDVMDKLLDLTDKLRLSKDPTVGYSYLSNIMALVEFISIPVLFSICFIWVSHDFLEAVVVSLTKEIAAMLVSQNNPED